MKFWRGRRPFAVWLGGLLCLWGALQAGPAFAQRDASLEAMLKDANLEGRATETGPIAKSNVAEVNLQVHWQLWRQVHANGGPGVDELRALAEDGRSVAKVNQVTRAVGVMALASRHPNVEEGHQMFLAAQRLAPELPYPYFAHAEYLVRRDPGKVPRWTAAFSKAYSAAWKWPDTRFPWALKVLLYACVAALAAGFGFLVAQTMRQFGVVAYDLARVMPRGFSSNQTVVLLLAVIAVPGILFKSPIVILMILAVVTSVPQRWNERLVSLLMVASVAALPWVDKAADNLASYTGSQTQALVAAQYITCDAVCLEDLNARQVQAPDDKYVLFTQLLAKYRTGEPQAHKDILSVVAETQWPADITAYAENLAGAAALALGQADVALEWVGKAERGMPGQAAPAFNAMRAHQMKDELDAASSALGRATRRNIDQVSAHLSFDRRDVNSFVMTPGLPLDIFWDYHLRQPRSHRSILSPYWSTLSGGKFGLDQASLTAGVCFVFILLGGFLQRTGKLSTPCPKCGLARDPRDDGTTGAHHYCLPCYRTFVTGAGLDYKARVHNERVLGGRGRLQSVFRRGFSLVAPGTGHHVAGRSLTGYFISFFFVLGLMFARYPLGLVRPPQEILSQNWGAFQSIGWLMVSVAGFAALAAVLRDVDPVRIGRRGGR